MQKIIIGIQARSNNTRYPGKLHKVIDGKTVLRKIIEAVRHSERFINRSDYNGQIESVLVIPEGDEIGELYKDTIDIYEGPEDDVLTRYSDCLKHYDGEKICRVTADCYFMVSHVISRCIKAALRKKYDYVSNVLVRTYMEGHDVEVISRPLLKWLDHVVKDPNHREHVTSYIKTSLINGSFPNEFDVCNIMQGFDLSSIKTSIDTEEEYKKALKMVDNMKKKILEAKKYGTYYL